MCVVVVVAVEQIAVYLTNFVSAWFSSFKKRKKINNDNYFTGGFMTDNVS